MHLYLSDDSVRAHIQERVASTVGPDTAVLIGHSLGSVVAYEAVCAHPDWDVTLITLGSPLGIRNLVFDRLRPPPRDGRGRFPDSAAAWTNIADTGDAVALVKRLAPLFGEKVEDLLVNNGSTAHDVQPYLTAARPVRRSPPDWRAVPADASRRFLVAAGTEHYSGGDLPSVPDDLRKMAGFFGRHGYCEELPEVRLDPSSAALRTALSQWLNGSDRRLSDTAVIYYSGHGDTQANYFYLLTADSKENQYAGTAVRADYLLEALGENPRVRRVLLILDTCYAGQGAFDAADVAARMSPWQSFKGDDEGVWIVAAASPKQEAQERLFADAFIEAAEQLQQTTGTLQPYIGLEALIWQVNEILQRSGKRQRASWIPVTQAKGLAPFIPNLSYEADAPANVDLETRDRLRRRRAAELTEHWGAKARGVEVAAQAGWYFTGREAALTELGGWLADPAADARLRILTGDPGSGKSAVLGRLVTLADAVAEPGAPAAPVHPGRTLAAGSVAVALLARGKAVGELLTELAATLGIAAGRRYWRKRSAHDQPARSPSTRSTRQANRSRSSSR